MDRARAPIKVERAGSTRLPVLAGVLGRALLGDPIIQWPFEGWASEADTTALFSLVYEHPVELGIVWEGGDGAGVAVWIPPGDAALLAASLPRRDGAARVSDA